MNILFTQIKIYYAPHQIFVKLRIILSKQTNWNDCHDCQILQALLNVLNYIMKLITIFIYPITAIQQIQLIG